MKMKAKEGVRGIALMGVEYVCDQNGIVDIPDEFEAAALANGFDEPRVLVEITGTASTAE